MAKSRSFSIYLLKKEFNSSNCLKEESTLTQISTARKLPAKASLYLLDSVPYSPWWVGYFGISKNLMQMHKGALILVPVKDRWFALAFGHVAHNLKDSCYEYDFGLKVTLNCVHPKKLRSTDTIEPGASRRQRTQVPVESDLTYFDFDRDSSIIRSLTGKVKEEYAEFFKHATGSSNLRISTNVSAENLPSTCEKLLQIYEKDDYKNTFPNIRGIEPVRDPDVIGLLEANLLGAFREKDSTLSLTVPDLINYQEGLFSEFKGAGGSLLYEDVSMVHYHEYLENHGIGLESIDMRLLKKHQLCLCDENGDVKDSFSIFKSMIYDTSLNAKGPAFHLCDGNWYSVEQEYVSKLKTDLDPFFNDSLLMPYNHADEGSYNQDVAVKSKQYICLDETNISPSGQTQIEPCDLYTVSNDSAVFTHVKVSTRSHQLSHLFNQGVNSIEVIKSEPQSKDKLKALIRNKLNGNDEESYISPIEADKHQVVYAIATRKNKDRKSDNLPLFSRMSLRRCIKHLMLMSVSVICCFIMDSRVRQPGKPKQKKERSA